MFRVCGVITTHLRNGGTEELAFVSMFDVVKLTLHVPRTPLFRVCGVTATRPLKRWDGRFGFVNVCLNGEKDLEEWCVILGFVTQRLTREPTCFFFFS